MHDYMFFEICPNCGHMMDCYEAIKPFHHIGGYCLACGFQLHPEYWIMKREELAKARQELGWTKFETYLSDHYYEDVEVEDSY
jgi:hypothetical protein